MRTSQRLLEHLGRQISASTLDAWLPKTVVRRANSGLPWYWERPGLTIGLQCLNPQAEADRRQFGLHSLMWPAETAFALSWQIDLQTATEADLQAHFGQPAFVMPTLALYLNDEQQRQVLADLEPETGALIRLTVVHAGKAYGPVLPGTEDKPKVEVTPPPPPPLMPAISVVRHGDPLTADGYWQQGCSRRDYPGYAYLAQLPAVPMLGGYVAKEKLVSQVWRNTMFWTWVRPLDPAGREKAEQYCCKAFGPGI